MFEYLFTFRSLTAAQSARNVLSAEGIRAPVTRTPGRMAENGCGYAVRVSDKSGIRAVNLLRRKQTGFVHAYRLFPNGRAEEVRL